MTDKETMIIEELEKTNLEELKEFLSSRNNFFLEEIYNIDIRNIDDLYTIKEYLEELDTNATVEAVIETFEKEGTHDSNFGNLINYAYSYYIASYHQVKVEIENNNEKLEQEGMIIETETIERLSKAKDILILCQMFIEHKYKEIQDL